MPYYIYDPKRGTFFIVGGGGMVQGLGFWLYLPSGADFLACFGVLSFWALVALDPKP